MPRSTDRPDPANPLELGSILGQSQAFGLVAGRCSAAQAARLHRLRTTREFRRVTGCWRDFRSRHLGIDGRNADKIIRLWEEFGATYFEIAQLTSIHPDTFPPSSPPSAMARSISTAKSSSSLRRTHSGSRWPSPDSAVPSLPPGPAANFSPMTTRGSRPAVRRHRRRAPAVLPRGAPRRELATLHANPLTPLRRREPPPTGKRPALNARRQ